MTFLGRACRVCVTARVAFWTSGRYRPSPGPNPMREKIGRCLSVWGLHCSSLVVWDRAPADHNLSRVRLSSLCNGPGRILAK